MAENLRATHYADGTLIPKIDDASSWENLASDSPAFCWYDNDSHANAKTYGALYTWSTAMKNESSSSSNPSNVQGVCPNGWHFPSDEEWKELERQLGMACDEVDGMDFRGTNEGSQLAGQVDLWNDGPLVTNSAFAKTAFNGVPSGYRKSDGNFDHFHNFAHWWTSTEYSENGGLYREISVVSSGIKRTQFNKMVGFSVRCLKD